VARQVILAHMEHFESAFLHMWNILFFGTVAYICIFAHMEHFIFRRSYYVHCTLHLIFLEVGTDK